MVSGLWNRRFFFLRSEMVRIVHNKQQNPERIPRLILHLKSYLSDFHCWLFSTFSLLLFFNENLYLSCPSF